MYNFHKVVAVEGDISDISKFYRERSPKPEDSIEDMPDVSKGLTEVADVIDQLVEAVEFVQAGGKALEGKLEPLLEWIGHWTVGKGIELLPVLLSHIQNF